MYNVEWLPFEQGRDPIVLEDVTRDSRVCGIYSRDIAETKVTQVNSYSRESKHPLLCDMEET